MARGRSWQRRSHSLSALLITHAGCSLGDPVISGLASSSRHAGPPSFHLEQCRWSSPWVQPDVMATKKRPLAVRAMVSKAKRSDTLIVRTEMPDSSTVVVHSIDDRMCLSGPPPRPTPRAVL